jgi:hypothetical protein
MNMMGMCKLNNLITWLITQTGEVQELYMSLLNITVYFNHTFIKD